MIAVFRSRTETLNFATILKSYGINCSIVNTPRTVNVSCGISVKFSNPDINVARRILARRSFDTFAGFCTSFERLR